MSRNGSGTYSLPAGNPVSAGTTITDTWANTTLSDIASALTSSLSKDGQTTPTGNLPMGGFKLTGLGAHTALTDSVRNTYDLGVTGSAARNFMGKIGEYVSVKDFGAAGDGVADDSAEIQAAIDATPAGGKLYIPVGTYKVATGLTRTTSITIVGDGIYGSGGTVISYTGSGAAMTFTTSQNGLRLQDFRIAGTSAGTDGIVIKQCFNGIKLDHILVEGFTNGNALYLEDTWDITAIGCQFRQSSIGVKAGIGATYAVVNTVRLYGCDMTDCSSKGIELKSGIGWVVDGCDFSGIASNGFGIDLAPALTAGASRALKSISIRDCYIEKASGATDVVGIRLGNSATIGSSSIANNTFEGNYFDVTGDHISIDYAQDTAIKGNHHGTLTAGKKKLIVGTNCSRTFIDIRPRSDITNSGALTSYFTNDVITLSEAQGNYTSPEKSAFLAKPSTNILNVTGAGTVYSIVFGTSLYDIQSEYDTGTGIFTAAKAGKYLFSCGIVFNGASGMTYCQVRLVTTARTYDLFYGKCDASGTMGVSGSALADLAAGATANITIEVGGVGSNSVDIVQNYTFFSGALIG